MPEIQIAVGLPSSNLQRQKSKEKLAELLFTWNRIALHWAGPAAALQWFHVIHLFLTLVHVVQRFVLHLLSFIRTFCLFFVFFPLHNFELWATPSLHLGYAIKFSLRMSLPISEPSFCSGTKCLHPEQRDSELSAPVHFSPHLTAPEDIFYNVCGCIIELKQSSILRLTSFLFFFRGELEN